MVKVSDVMLDLATGDASSHDAYIQESMGQVKVSAAIYEAANQISKLSDSERAEIVQECATAGLPSDKEGAQAVILEAVERELIGTCRHLFAEMAKIEERSTKATTPYAIMNALNKQLGGQSQLDGSLEWAVEYAKNVGNLNLTPGAKCIKGSVAKKLTKNLIQGVCLLANALCIDTKALTEDKEVSAVVPALASTAPKKDAEGKDCCTTSYVADALKNAGKFVKTCDVTDSDYTEKATKKDIADVTACDFAVAKVAKFIKSKLDGKVEAKVKKACKGAKADSDSVADIAKTAVEVNTNLNKLCTNLIDAFNTTTSGVVETKTNE